MSSITQRLQGDLVVVDALEPLERFSELADEDERDYHMVNVQHANSILKLLAGSAPNGRKPQLGLLGTVRSELIAAYHAKSYYNVDVTVEERPLEKRWRVERRRPPVRDQIGDAKLLSRRRLAQILVPEQPLESARLSGDQAGRTRRSMMRPKYNAALRFLDEGLASASDMDLTCKLGLGYADGPIERIERGGLARHYEITQALFEVYGSPGYAPARRAHVAHQRAARRGRPREDN